MLMPGFRFFQHRAADPEVGNGPRKIGTIRRSAKAFGRFMDPRPVLKDALPAFRVGYVLYRVAVVFFLELSYRLKGYEIRRQPPAGGARPLAGPAGCDRRESADHPEKPLGGQ